MMIDRYESPLSSRYASEEMLSLFSQQTRIHTWRRLWIELARAEHELGLPISKQQIAELELHVDDIDFAYAAIKEQEFRHDVVAHIYAYGKVAPSAAGILHMGATSCYVTDNADLILYRKALQTLRAELLSVISGLAGFANAYKSLPALGYTHYQPARLVTVGKRAALWLQDFLSDCEELDFVLGSISFLGCRGVVGTEVSLLDLFGGDGEKVDELNRRLAAAFGFDRCFDICSQTYPRKLDSRILNCLSSIAQSCYHMAADIRLLQHDGHLEEPAEPKQIGSSALPHKRNPMRCERICSLSRYLMTDALNAAVTASSQWLERSLDDSAIRRISMPEGFLCADAVLRLSENVVSGLVVNQNAIEATIQKELPYLATESLLMKAVADGKDRLMLYERIRQCCQSAIERSKQGEAVDLATELAGIDALGMTRAEIQEIMAPEKHIGRCVEQVDLILEKARPLIVQAGRSRSDITI